MTTEEHETITEIQLPKKGADGRKKPKFRRQESWRYKRVTDKWRKPHGIDSKMRKKIKGWPVSPTTGYRSPKNMRGLHPSGFIETHVRSVADLEGINPELQAIRISRTVGGRKRVEIMALAEEKGIHVLNPRAIREPAMLEKEADVEKTEDTSKGDKKK